jgi:hypothetical protein
MRHIITAALLLLAATAQSAQVTIDFEEFSRGPIDPPDGDLVSKGFALEYLDQGSGYPIIEIIGSLNGTQAYMNCSTCQAVEQIDLSSAAANNISLHAIDIGALGAAFPSFDFIFTGFLAGGGSITQSALGVSTLQTLLFDASWSGLESVRIQIDNANGVNAYASFIDNIVVSQVPVPAAVWLFGSGLAAMGLIRRRRPS